VISWVPRTRVSIIICSRWIMRAFASVHPSPALLACWTGLEPVTAAFAGRANPQSNIRTIIRRWYPRHQACSLGCVPPSCGSGSRHSHAWRRLLSATRGMSIDSAETPSSAAPHSTRDEVSSPRLRVSRVHRLRPAREVGRRFVVSSRVPGRALSAQMPDFLIEPGLQELYP
jgi:hypothetical protein